MDGSSVRMVRLISHLTELVRISMDVFIVKTVRLYSTLTDI